MKLALALVAVLCGCAALESRPLDAAPSTPPASAARRSCNTEGAKGVVGRAYDAALGTELLRRTGADRIRVVRPGQMVTMEFDERRLTVELDARDRVASVRCG